MLVGFGRPPEPLVGVGEKNGARVPGVEVAVAEGVKVNEGVGVTGSSWQGPGPILPRLYSSKSFVKASTSMSSDSDKLTPFE